MNTTWIELMDPSKALMILAAASAVLVVIAAMLSMFERRRSVRWMHHARSSKVSPE